MDNFTPLNETRTERLSFSMESVTVLSGDLDVRGYGKRAVVKIDGKTYNVYGAACSLPSCACDAFIREVVA